MSDITAPTGLFDRAIRRITTVWRDMADRVSTDEDQGIASQMRACLDARGGEVSARNRAAKLAQAYLTLDAEGRKGFLRDLASFDSDPEAVSRAYEAVRSATDDAERATAKVRLRRALEGQACVDTSWTLSARGDGTFDREYLFGHSGVQYVLWVLGTVAGVAVPGLDTRALGLDAVFPAFFLALLIGEVRDRL